MGEYVVHLMHPGEDATNALCSASSKRKARHVTNNPEQVTCRNCLRMIEQGWVEKMDVPLDVRMRMVGGY